MYRVVDRTEGRVEEPNLRPADAGAHPAEKQSGLLNLVWHRKVLIAVSAIIGAAALIGIGQLIPPRYNAVAQILVDPSELRVLDSGLRSQSPFNEALIAEVETQMRVLLSRNVLARVVADQKLAEDQEFTGEGSINPIDMLRQLARYIGVGTPDDSVSSTASLKAMRALEKRVWVRRSERTYVVELGVGTEDREKSVRLADSIVVSFLEEQRLAQSHSAQQATEMLNARLGELRARAVDAEERVEQFKRDNNILSAGGQLVIERQVGSISDQLVQARSRAAEAQARFNQISAILRNGGDVSAISEATGSQTVAALRAQQGVVARREAELSATLMPKHPLLIRAREQLRKIGTEIDAEVRRIAEATSREYQRAQSNQESLEQSLNAVKRDLTATNDKLVQLREVERDADASRVVYEASLKRTQEVSEQVKLTLANTRVISHAAPAQYRSLPPSKAVLGLGGLLLGSLAGFGLAFASSNKLAA